MVYESLIAIVENRINDLAAKWVLDVKKTSYLSSYKKLSDEELSYRGYVLFSNLLNWLLNGASNDDASEYFKKIGEDRINEGMPLTEVYYALYLEKRVLWNFIASENEVSGKLKAVDAIEFMTVINNYFDLGDFYIIKGYNEQLYLQLSNSGKFNKEELENNFAKGSLFQECRKNINDNMFGDGLKIDLIQ